MVIGVSMVEVLHGYTEIAGWMFGTNQIITTPGSLDRHACQGLKKNVLNNRVRMILPSYYHIGQLFLAGSLSDGMTFSIRWHDIFNGPLSS